MAEEDDRVEKLFLNQKVKKAKSANREGVFITIIRSKIFRIMFGIVIGIVLLYISYLIGFIVGADFAKMFAALSIGFLIGIFVGIWVCGGSDPDAPTHEERYGEPFKQPWKP